MGSGEQDEEKVFKAHYVSGTHWDREWYRPFQEFRVLLVRLVDRLLDLIQENEEFEHFHLDGQTCILKDYTEIRPEKRERLEEFIQDGRILIGPWFTMPDLFCPGQEALVRNLLMGQTIAREWGVEPMKVAYTCDMFGHPPQMPQIYNGFDLGDCILGRGTNEHSTPPFFTWQAPDGSEVFTFKLQDRDGYGAFGWPRQVLERPRHYAQNNSEFAKEMEEAGFDTGEGQRVKEKWFRKALSDYIEHEVERASAPVICLMDWMDHMDPAEEIERYLRLIEETCPAVEAQHSSLPAFFRDARAETEEVPVKEGELREPAKKEGGYLWLIPNCVTRQPPP